MVWTPGWNILPMLPNCTDSFAWGVSADGSTAVGYNSLPSPDNDHGVYWTSAGITDIGMLPSMTYNDPWACNADGSVIVGDSGHSSSPLINGTGNHSYRWTQATGCVALTPDRDEAQSAESISDDGNIISSSSNTTGVFIWTASGITVLTTGLQNQSPTLSPNGLWGAGRIPYPTYTCYIWHGGSNWIDTGVGLGTYPVIDDTGKVFTLINSSTSPSLQQINPTTPPVTIDLAPGYTYASGDAVTVDGSKVVGFADDENGDSHVYRWTAATGMVILDTLPIGYDSPGIFNVNRDASVMVGTLYDTDNLETAFVFYAPYAPPPSVSQPRTMILA